jgi:hypothetical protein
MVNLHPPLKGGPPLQAFNKGAPPFFKSGWIIGLTNQLLKGDYVQPEGWTTLYMG